VDSTNGLPASGSTCTRGALAFAKSFVGTSITGGTLKDFKNVTKTFTLTPGTYVLFCNIDNHNGATVLNHFQHGMNTTLTAI